MATNLEALRGRAQAIRDECENWQEIITQGHELHQRIGTMADTLLDVMTALVEASMSPTGGGILRASEGARALMAELLPAQRALTAIGELADRRAAVLGAAVAALADEVAAEHSVRVEP